MTSIHEFSECYQDVIPLDVTRLILSHLDGVDTIAFSLACKDFQVVVNELPKESNITQAVKNKDFCSLIKILKLLEVESDIMTTIFTNGNDEYIISILASVIRYCGIREFTYLMTYVFNQSRLIPYSKNFTYADMTKTLNHIVSRSLYGAYTYDKPEFIEACKMFGLGECRHAISCNFSKACFQNKYEFAKNLIDITDDENILQGFAYVCQMRKGNMLRGENVDKENLIITLIMEKYSKSPFMICINCGTEIRHHMIDTTGND